MFQLTIYLANDKESQSKNVVQEKFYEFAKRIVRMYRHLSKEKKEFVLSKQVLKSGPSIEANIEDAIGGSSKRNFKAKLNISHREARETKFWIRLLRDTEYLEEKPANSMITDCEELLKILFSIIRSSS